jgi:Tfp pilus assembly protein PilV
MKKILIASLLLGASALAMAKIPAPVLDDAAKAKAAETAAKTAWSGKVDAYALCKSQDRAAAAYYKSAKASGKPTKPAAATPPCADPGPFVYKPVVAGAPAVAAAPAAVPAASPAAKAAPAAPAAPAKKS